MSLIYPPDVLIRPHLLTTCLLSISVYNWGIHEARTVMKIIYRDQEWELHGQWRVRDAIEQVGLVPHTVLAVRNGKLLTEDTTLEEKDEVRLIAVVAGG